MTAAEKVARTAAAEVGYQEKASNNDLDNATANAGSSNWNKYAKELDAIGDIYNGRKNGYDWCDIFVDWCFIHTFGKSVGVKLLNQPLNGCGAGCTWSMRYYKQAGRFFASPEVGDQIFYTKDGGNTSYHTGLVVEVHGNIIKTVEGNSSDRVAEHCFNYRQSYVAGFGRPDWSQVPEDKPAPSTWAAKAWYKAVEAGILDGTAPTGPMTREMLAVVLDRLGLLK